MGFRNFNVNIIIRILLIILTSVWLTFEIKEPQKAYTRFFIASLIIIQSVSLVYYFNRINKELIRFLKILKVKDSSYRFSSDLKGNFSELAKILNNTADLIENARIEKEKQYQFLQFVIEQINVGLFAFNNYGDIHFANKSFMDLFDLKKINSIEDLSSINIELPIKLKSQKPNETFQHKVKTGLGYLQLLVQKNQFKFNNELINLVSIQNISAELDRKELDSWQRLIRVLTHEIMNSIAPITNMTYSIRRSLKEEVDQQVGNNEILKEAIDDTEIIERRSKNLLHFVDDYRKLTKIGNLNLKLSNLNQLIENVVKIFKEDFKNKIINHDIEIDKQIEINIDEKLIEQAFINLIKNSIEAITDQKNPKIIISVSQKNNETIIKISDNGKGIEEDKIDNIFIPFYSTKEHGSGIGLSLVRQIVNLHKGTISVSSIIRKGTTFQIKL